MDRVVQILMAPFVVAVALIWTVVGLVFAAPLIAKAILIFTIDLLVSAITQQRTSRAAEGLKQALTFYPQGFAIIFSSLTHAHEPVTEEQRAYEFARGRFGPLVDSGKMILLALVFWGTTALFFHHLGVVRIERIAMLEQTALNLVGLGRAQVAEAAPRFVPDCSINTPNTNLRSAARLQSESITRLPQDAQVMLINDPFAGDDWIRIATQDGKSGYVNRDLLTCSVDPR
ncbi:MAG: SH3 domain-containing protein [Hyphomonadaceae bacterium]|nr:SH3 domain-containing protein [Hyphomonadaceae bacterium]